ncbi:long-chain fatty acid--CoA ligase [Streptomyces sp. NPDC048483]|uniref:AMP-dependent synthetase/ligase n=1 Tax=Streptomyces sp. NPDC048483 TaxID=3154927 RepID=UPI003432557D
MHSTSIPSKTVATLAFAAAERFGDAPAQRFHRDGRWEDLTYAELGKTAGEIGLGLARLGVQPGDRVCVLADTRPEFAQVQFGIAAAGAVVVPIYPSSSPEECAWVLGDSGATAVICENTDQLAKIEQIRDRVPGLRHTLLIDPAHGTATPPSLDALRRDGRAGEPAELRRRIGAVRTGDPAVIIYTSGTTGRPKGCVLTHRNLMASCRVTEHLRVVGPDDVAYLFLPLAHVFAQVVLLGMTGAGGVVVFSSGGASSIVSDCAEVAPTFLPSVPRVYEKIHARFTAQEPPVQLDQDVMTGLAVRRLEAEGRPVPAELRSPFERAEKQLFARVRAVFGGRLRMAISGAAPIAPDVLRFFHAAGVPVCEGYGLSESTSLGTLNPPHAARIGTIGLPVPGCEVRLAEDGEILLRGPHVFAGYWNNAQATAEALDGDWLRTGDLGAVDDEYVTITGRKKDIIITAGGKNITPVNLEHDLRRSPFISHAVMYGDRRPYPVALLTLDAEQILPWAQVHGLPHADIDALAAHPQVLELVHGLVDQANSRYARVSQIKKFAILGHDFSEETGELTPTLKVRRQAVHEKYAHVFDALYI